MDPTSLLQQSLVNTVPHTIMVHWYLLWSGREFQDLTKIWPNFLTTHHWCLTCSQCVCSLWRVVRPWSWTQPAYCNNHWWIQCLIPSWCTDIYSGQGENFRIWPKSGLTFWPHIIDVWHVPSVYVACEGLSDLGHGPNQPTATIIGDTVPHTIMVHWYLLWSGWEFQDLTKIWPNFLTTHHWCLTCSQCVCSLWRVVRPWSWTQPAYCNNHWWDTVPHTIMVHWYLLWSGREFQDLTKIWPNFLTTHHWCLTCSQCVCSLWRVVRPWSWTQPAYCNNHWWIQCLIHHGALIFTLVRARISGSDQNLA